jgi:hypothetical protein
VVLSVDQSIRAPTYREIVVLSIGPSIGALTYRFDKCKLTKKGVLVIVLLTQGKKQEIRKISEVQTVPSLSPVLLLLAVPPRSLPPSIASALRAERIGKLSPEPIPLCPFLSFRVPFFLGFRTVRLPIVTIFGCRSLRLLSTRLPARAPRIELVDARLCL